MNSPRRQAFTLVELIVVIVIIVCLVGLMLPPAGPVRETGRANACKNNIKQLQRAIAEYELTHGQYPDYINTLGHPNGNKTRASWVVKTFDYLELAPLATQWEQGQYVFSSLDILQCPSDPPETIDQPHLSYVANAGYINNSIENKANGIFFDRTRIANGAPGPADPRDQAESPEIIVTLKYLQSHDGAARTILLSENKHALHWGYTTLDEQQNLPDQKYHFGFCWEQPKTVIEDIQKNEYCSAHRINGKMDGNDPMSFQSMTPDNGIPASFHPGGVHVAFVAGNVQLLSDRVDPFVYAQLMTSNSKESDLLSTDDKPEKAYPPPTEGDY